jgi:hypothetical protein
MKTEKTVVSIFALGILLKAFDIPGHSLLLIFSAAIISIMYFPVAFYFFSDKALKNQNIALSIVGGMMLAIMPLGILFKLMFWPGAMTELTASLIFSPILLVITFWLNKKNNGDLKTYYKNYIIRISFWFVLCLIFYFTPNNTLIKIQHHNNPELARLKIQAYENPDNIEFDIALQNYYRQRDSLYMIENDR